MNTQGFISQSATAKTVTIDPATIIIPPRQRQIDAKHVQAIIESINQLGKQTLIEPIVINGDTNEIIDGAHRLTAVQQLGWPQVDAVAWYGLNGGESRLIEAEANLYRLDLSPAQKLEAWEQVYKPMFDTLVAAAKADETLTPPTVGAFMKQQIGLTEKSLDQVIQIRNLAQSTELGPEAHKLVSEAYEQLQKPNGNITAAYRDAVNGAKKQVQSKEISIKNSAQNTIDKVQIYANSLYRLTSPETLTASLNALGEPAAITEPIENSIKLALANVLYCAGFQPGELEELTQELDNQVAALIKEHGSID